ncbi:MAG: WbqC family protein [Elusimicrobia bacterium]|nr:WbqC family protein [Elusimicrobiota bacterium]
MILGAHQPQYLPWLGYFDKIARSDVFVLMDDVQYKKNEWQNRNKVKTPQGPQWLTVPVLYSFGQLIKEVKVNESDHWRDKNPKTLRQAYSKAPHFHDYQNFIDSLHSQPWENLSDLNVFCVKALCEILSIQTRLLLSSSIQAEGKSTERLVNLCKALGADTYLSGAGGRDYLELSLFEKAGIRVVFQQYEHPEYQQLHGDFVSHLAVIDLLFNSGGQSREILLSGGKPI